MRGVAHCTALHCTALHDMSCTYLDVTVDHPVVVHVGYRAQELLHQALDFAFCESISQQSVGRWQHRARHAHAMLSQDERVCVLLTHRSNETDCACSACAASVTHL